MIRDGDEFYDEAFIYHVMGLKMLDDYQIVYDDNVEDYDVLMMMMMMENMEAGFSCISIDID